MQDDDEAPPGPVAPTTGRAAKRPDFTADSKFQRLVSVMDVKSVTALNDPALQISDFRNKAAELWNQQPDVAHRAPGSFKSWEVVLETLLKFADAPSPTKSAASAAAGEEAADGVVAPQGEAAQAPEDIDGAVADSVQVVQALLAGQDLDLDLDLNEAKLEAYTKALYAHADKLDAAVRGKFEELAGSDSTVEDVVKMVEVPFRVERIPSIFRLDHMHMVTILHGSLSSAPVGGTLSLLSSTSHISHLARTCAPQALDTAGIPDDVLQSNFGLTKDQPACDARALIEYICEKQSAFLDSKAAEGKAQLLSAYAKIAAKEEALMLADQIHSKEYSKNTIVRGRQHFINYLESIQHRCMSTTSSEEVLKMLKRPLDNLAKLTETLSYITPADAEGYIAIFSSKNQARRKLIIGIGNGRKITTCVGHSASCNARAAAAWCWRAIDQVNKWAPNPLDPSRGSGCPFYSERVTKALMNKAKLDLREQRGKVSAQLIYIEDHTEYLRLVIKREVRAWADLVQALTAHPPATADRPLSPSALTQDAHTAKAKQAYSAWANKLMLPESCRFFTTLQREGGQRAEIANLTVAEIQVLLR